MFFIAMSLPVWLVAERYLDEGEMEDLRRSLTGSVGGDIEEQLKEEEEEEEGVKSGGSGDNTLLGKGSVKSDS